MSDLKWVITKVTVLPEEFNCLYEVHFTVMKTGINREGVEKTAMWNSYITFNPALVNKEDFVQFEDVTEEMVIQWVQDNLGERRMDNIEQMMDYGLRSKLLSEEAVEVKLPWEK